jgi:hypothetical protein
MYGDCLIWRGGGRCNGSAGVARQHVGAAVAGLAVADMFQCQVITIYSCCDINFNTTLVHISGATVREPEDLFIRFFLNGGGSPTVILLIVKRFYEQRKQKGRPKPHTKSYN